jgi:uncharacterized membrane protein
MSQKAPSLKERIAAFPVVSLFSLGVIIATAILLTYNYSRLPEQIPIHFNGQGEADGFGSKSWLILLPIVSLAIWFPVFWLQNRPHQLNYPVRITPENAEHQYALASQFLQRVNLIQALLFLAATRVTIQAALNGSNRISPWTIPVFLIGIGVALIIYIIKAGSRSSSKVVR